MRVRHAAGRPASAVARFAVVIALLLVPSRRTGAQGTLSALETDVDKIARNARPSVVTILAQRTAVPTGRHGVPTRPRLRTRIGSGVAVEESFIITTASVIDRAEKLTIYTTNGLQAEAEVVGSDPIFNLAVLRVRGVRLPPLPLATHDPPQEGEWVMAIGTSPYRAQITQSVGTIAYRHREPRLSLLQLTNVVYPGCSGGAALNARGQLVGIVQGELGPSPGSGSETYQGAHNSFVLPAEAVKPVYLSLKNQGRMRHGYLGVSTRAASVESETEKGSTIPIGALVESVQPGGPAARVGLVKGDLIVGFERARVESPEQLARWVAATPPGATVELVWARDELQRGARVVLSDSPDANPQWARLGGAESGQSATRIADLEREIRRLNQELERLKGGSSPPR